MSVVFSALESFLKSLESYFKAFDVAPTYYAALFPPTINYGRLSDMIINGTFPTIMGIFVPASFFCLVLGILRLAFQFTIFEVNT